MTNKFAVAPSPESDHAFNFAYVSPGLPASMPTFCENTRHIAIVLHPKKELPIGTRSIIRQSGLTPQDFGF